ncbi:MAG TPA: hypothetical protein VHI51_21050 [Ktedonobacterales bacterium]|nr:hypothetical protein [Ktedonobacterales bacterium]
MPAFIQSGDSPARLLLMLLAYEAILLTWLSFSGVILSRAGQSRYAERIRAGLQALAGLTLIALGMRLAFERQ